MNATRPDTSPTQPSVVLTLAKLLERLERSGEPIGAEQYRSVVVHLIQELGAPQLPPELPAVLDSHPATAELYENLNYAHAGLCRSALEFSLNAELRAKDVIDKARRSAHEETQGRPKFPQPPRGTGRAPSGPEGPLKQSNQGATRGED